MLPPRRRVGTFASLKRNRRLAKDFDVLISTAATLVMIASVKLIMPLFVRTFMRSMRFRIDFQGRINILP